MAIGDNAVAEGLPLVPDTGDAGEVRLGAQEINRTRDMVATVMQSIPASWPTTRGGTGGTDALTGKEGLGIYSGTAAASDSVGGSQDGNIYFQILS